MFEIGNSLREARLRQGFDLVEAEQATKIRTKYLQALEEERFELLPAQTYVKGFLRSYAEFLGLDGQIYLDEYNTRHASGEEEVPLRPRRRPPPPAHRRVESSVVMIALAGIAAAAALVIVAWKWGGNEPPNRIPNLGTETPAEATPSSPAQERPADNPAATSKNRWIRVAVTARTGDSWVAARRGDATGKLLFTGTLERGRTQRFVGPRVWLNVGAPGNLVVKLNGRRVALPVSGDAPAVLVATQQGIAPASST